MKRTHSGQTSSLLRKPSPSFIGETIFILISSFIVCFLVESFSRTSPVSTFTFLFSSPTAYLFNVLIIACTFSFVLLSSRRTFYFLFVFIIWIVLGISSCCLGSLRMTPLVFYDIILLINNISITTAYLSVFEMILVILLLIGVLLGLFALFRYSPKRTVHYRKSIKVFLAFWCLTVSIAVPYSANHQDFSNTIKSYQEYGFAYSFIRSAIDRGISQPELYEADMVDELIHDISDDQTSISAFKKRPNFVFVQLESFLDPALIQGVQCSEDPVPTFTYLKNNASSGYLHVPSIGGGTANVEFEVITGMRLNDFGTGEYPYTSLLQNQTCESAAYALKNLGYSTHAIHNHNATFYNRHLVYPNIGFDTFTALEYMKNYKTNERGWCHDDVLTDYIIKALDSTADRDMVFTISVQGHGNYSAEPPETPYEITSSGLEENPNRKHEFEDYINAIHQTDAFLGELVETLKSYPEPVVLVAYGDHLPALPFSEDDLITHDHLVTEYILWSNDGRLVKYDKDMYAYQLASYALNRCGITEGILVRFHQEYMHEPDYLSRLTMLEYDLLYANDPANPETSLPAPTSMNMGLDQIAVSSAVLHGDLLIVKGENFTKHSIVLANDNELSTQYIDENMLIARITLLSRAEAGDLITVAQCSSDSTILSQTAPVLCQVMD